MRFLQLFSYDGLTCATTSCTLCIVSLAADLTNCEDQTMTAYRYRSRRINRARRRAMWDMIGGLSLMALAAIILGTFIYLHI